MGKDCKTFFCFTGKSKQTDHFPYKSLLYLVRHISKNRKVCKNCVVQPPHVKDKKAKASDVE